MTDAAALSGPQLPPELSAAIDRFDQASRDLLAVEEAGERIDHPLYHYTGAVGLKGVLDTQQLWFTDYRHLNDPSELRFGVGRVHEALHAAGEGADDRVSYFLRFAADLFSPENLDALAFFVASFSRARNDLGQWRAYADNGRGFAIGFAPRKFEARPDLSASPEENAFLCRVHYDAEAAVGRIRLGIDQAASIFRDTANANADLLRDRAVGLPFVDLLAKRLIASWLVWCALTTKHPAYAREEEVRLIIMGTVPRLLAVTQTRTRAGEIVPYIAHPWAIQQPDDLAEIVIGPAAPPDTERSLRTLLATRGLQGVKVERSDIPYRAL
jgi:hypothetical protein